MKDLVGKIVIGTIARVEEYGLWVEYDGVEILVMIPDVSAKPIRLKSAYDPGDRITLRVLRHVPERGYVGTMKDL